MAEASKVDRRPQATKRSYPRKNINNSNKHFLTKRAPKKNIRQENAVYVTRNTVIKAHVSKCEKLLDEKFNEIYIHCMGAAIQHGINLALQLCEKHPDYQFAANTSTITLIDDLEPLTDEDDYEIQRRPNSAVHIKIFKLPDPAVLPSTS